jgi:type II secretory pathway pseudopilin PulG
MFHSKTTQKPNTRKGFTLLEIVIALGIFMLFMGAILNTFISLTSTQQKANLSREGMSEAKEILNFISVEAREKRIDYFCNPPSTGIPAQEGTTALTLGCGIDDDNTVLVFVSNNGLERLIIQKLNNENQEETNGQPSINVTAQTQRRNNIFSNWQTINEIPLHSERLKIKDINAQITPTQDPYDFGNDPEPLQHPVAQIRLEIYRNAQNPDESAEQILIQTSVASRAYSPQEV